MKIRLHQFLSQTGVFASKRDAKEAVWAGDITVNGSVVKNISFQFNPRTKPVTYRGDVLELPEEHVTLILNKPPGYVCSRINKHERSLGKTPVFDLLPDHLSQRDKDRMLTVGRLDEATTGMLVLTTDGRTVNRVTDPQHHVPKVYLVRTAEPLSEDVLASLRNGVDIELEVNGEVTAHRTQPADVHQLASNDAQVTLHEGKKRQVRRMFSSLGHKVVDLHRTAIGELWLEDLGLREGDCLDLSGMNVLALMGLDG